MSTLGTVLQVTIKHISASICPRRRRTGEPYRQYSTIALVRRSARRRASSYGQPSMGDDRLRAESGRLGHDFRRKLRLRLSRGLGSVWHFRLCRRYPSRWPSCRACVASSTPTKAKAPSKAKAKANDRSILQDERSGIGREAGDSLGSTACAQPTARRAGRATGRGRGRWQSRIFPQDPHTAAAGEAAPTSASGDGEGNARNPEEGSPSCRPCSSGEGSWRATCPWYGRPRRPKNTCKLPTLSTQAEMYFRPS